MSKRLNLTYPLFLSNCNKLEFSRQSFEKSSNIEFTQNPSSGSRVVPCWRMDGQTDRQRETDGHDEAQTLTQPHFMTVFFMAAALVLWDQRASVDLVKQFQNASILTWGYIGTTRTPQAPQSVISNFAFSSVDSLLRVGVLWMFLFNFVYYTFGEFRRLANITAAITLTKSNMKERDIYWRIRQDQNNSPKCL